jgi:exosortase/archaeosortase
MTETDVTYLIAACAGVFSLALFVGLILAPAWSAYSRIWERVAASVLSLYVLAVLVGIGVAGGLAVVYFWV